MMKRFRVNFLLILLLFSFIVLLVFNNIKYINLYKNNDNAVISNFISIIKEKYPDVSTDELVDILNSENINDNVLDTYGIDIYEDVVSLRSKKILQDMFLWDISALIILTIIIIALFNLYIRKNNKDIKKLIYYVEEINRRNYKLDMLSNSEGNLSILQNEIYKTMVALKESAELSLEDKMSLKNSLSDISHQLKTPLTSISIMLDNIIDDPSMSEDVRNDFILDIKREIVNINFLVHNILKLSKFDTNTVEFKKEKINVSKLFKDVICNVDVLSDLKNIVLKIKCDDNIFINGDYKWEVEALTNIVKNSIEHSNSDSEVVINVTDNKVYTRVIIKDYGNGIDAKDIRHIFERFYKVSDSSSSFGIGLNLAKIIIENDNGLIKVMSEKGKGTTFEIKYMK